MTLADKLSLVDRVVGSFSPKRAVRRERQRALAAAWRQARMHYEGATTGRRAFGWTTVSTDANAVNTSARSRLRDVARDLVRNNATATRAVTVIANNVVARGIIPTIEADKEQDRVDLERLLKEHFDTAGCDAAGRQDLYGLQNLAIRAIATDGEVLIRRRRRLAIDGFPMPFQLQVMESDYLDASVDGVSPVNVNNLCVQGVEFNPFGKIVGYHLFDQHPGATTVFGGVRSFTSHFVPASEIAHVFVTLRPGQIRGVSWFAPVILRMKDLGDFKEAHLMRQKIAACFAAFIETEEAFEEDLNAPDNEFGAPPFETFEPGMVERLLPGQKVTFGTPPQVQDFDPYVKSLDREIAAGLGISYEALSGDLSGVNFSSGRMGWLEFNRNVDGWRDYMLIPQMLAVVAGWFLESAQVVLGRRLVGAKVKWTSPRREMISPTDEVGAIRSAIRSGITSRSEEQRKLGFDPSDLDKEIAADNVRGDALGLVLDSDPRKTSNAGLTQARPDGTVIPSPDVT